MLVKCTGKDYESLPKIQAHSSTVLNGDVWVYGGYNYRTDEYSKSLLQLQFDSNKMLTWTEVANNGHPPNAMAYGSLFAFNDNLFFIFGYNGQEDQMNNNLYCFSD